MSHTLNAMSIARSTKTKRGFLLFLAMIILVVEPSSSAKFLSVPAFQNKVENRLDGKLSLISSLKKHQTTRLFSPRGGAKDEEETDGEDVNEDSEDDDDEYDEISDDEDEADSDTSDEDDYYDDETDDEEESQLASQLKRKSSTSSHEKKSSDSFVEPYFVSPSLQMYTTFGTILLSRKIDMFNPKVVRLVRFLFILYLVVQQAFIFYVRIMAKRNNDRTPVQVKNPLTDMLSSQLEKQPAGASDMVKNLASSFLKTESTIVEYDMGQTKNMQGGVLFNMLLMWFLHFKMQQVQPLLVTTINGFLQLIYNPLFQVYVMGRNLERPFKSPEVFKDPRKESETTETTTEDGTSSTVEEDGEVDEAEDSVEEDDQEENSDDEDVESSDDEDVEGKDDSADEEDETE